VAAASCELALSSASVQALYRMGVFRLAAFAHAAFRW
jgi:hypothetical protein